MWIVQLALRRTHTFGGRNSRSIFWASNPGTLDDRNLTNASAFRKVTMCGRILWLFVFTVGLADTALAYRYWNDFNTWESNPVMAGLAAAVGMGAVFGLKWGFTGYAWFMSHFKSRFTSWLNLAALTGHGYVALAIAQFLLGK